MCICKTHAHIFLQIKGVHPLHFNDQLVEFGVIYQIPVLEYLLSQRISSYFFF